MEPSLHTLWNTILTEMKSKTSGGSFAGFIKQAHLISLQNNVASIAVSSAMARNMMQRFKPELESLLSQQTGKPTIVLFVIQTTPHKQKNGKTDTITGPLFATQESLSDKKQSLTMIGHLPRVRADFTFATFAVSTTNNLAFVSAQRVAQHIGASYNPLFIYGPVGVGKTHLMHAIANEVYQKDPTKKIIYITSEEFTNEVVEAIRTNDTAKMKKRFRSANLLIIDDIQFIEGKEKVQEELFHTFNILVDNSSQICLTSDRPPQEIKKLQKRLSSRFAGGLTVDIGEPDLELKTAILRKKAEKYGYELPIDVALFLADNAKDSRTLEGLLLRVVTEAMTTQSDVTLDLAKQALGKQVQEKSTHLHAEDILLSVCNYYQVKPTQLRGPKREASLVRARQVAMYILYVKMKKTLVEVGNLLGGRDHTTIMHGVEKITKLVENKDPIVEDIRGITGEAIE